MRNIKVIPLSGDFSCRSVGIAKRQHDWPSLTLISDAVDSQTRCTFSQLGAAQQSVMVQRENNQECLGNFKPIAANSFTELLCHALSADTFVEDAGIEQVLLILNSRVFHIQGISSKRYLTGYPANVSPYFCSPISIYFFCLPYTLPIALIGLLRQVIVSHWPASPEVQSR